MKKLIIIVPIILFVAGALAHAKKEAAKTDPIKVKVLIVDGLNNHDWAATTPVMKKVLEDCGRFDVDVSTVKPQEQKIEDYKPDFCAYDVVLMNYNNDAVWGEETRNSFEDYVSNGGGLVIIHGADNSFPSWQEYNRMIGLGGWGGRNEKSGPYVYYTDEGQLVRDDAIGHGGGHGSQFEPVLVVRDADHPITKGLPSTWKHGMDELYHKLRGPAENMTILTTAYDTNTIALLAEKLIPQSISCLGRLNKLHLEALPDTDTEHLR